MKEKNGAGKSDEKKRERELHTLERITDFAVLAAAVLCVLFLGGVTPAGSLILFAALLAGLLLHLGLALSLFLRGKTGLAAVSAGAAFFLTLCLIFAAL